MDGVEGFARLNINNASGVYLDVIGALRNIPRSQGAPQKVGLRLTINTNNFIQFSIPEGQAFTSLDGSYTFLNDTTYTVASAAAENILFASFTSLGDSGINRSTDSNTRVCAVIVTRNVSNTSTNTSTDDCTTKCITNWFYPSVFC